jgi:hypothetical protein
MAVGLWKNLGACLFGAAKEWKSSIMLQRLQRRITHNTEELKIGQALLCNNTSGSIVAFNTVT